MQRSEKSSLFTFFQDLIDVLCPGAVGMDILTDLTVLLTGCIV